MPRAATATTLTLAALLLTGCAGSGRSGAVAPPPAPRLDSSSPGADPLDEAPRRPQAAATPAPPVADVGVAPVGSGMPAPAGRDATLYEIGGRALTSADLGDFLLRYFPDRAREPLGQLVDEALVEMEARREGMAADSAAVSARAAAYVEERRREVRVQYGPETTLEQLLERTFGRTLPEFAQDAERLARVALLRDLLVRLDQRREARVEVRALTFGDEQAARDAVERLRAGADLTLMARRLGIRAPAAPPPIGRDEIRPPERADEVFAAGRGVVLEPRAFRGPDGATYWEVVKVVDAWEADRRPWEQLRGAVEESVAQRPVGVPEYLAWRRRALRRARVDVHRDGRGLVPWIEEE